MDRRRWSSLPAVQLGERHAAHLSSLPSDLAPDFEALWRLHPYTFHRIAMMGREVPVPRWSRAYGADYRYSGRIDRAGPVPDLLSPVLAWARQSIEPRLRGLLVNWYDDARGHRIGPHRDSTRDLLPGTPIVTISLGGARVFRLRPWRGAGYTDIPVAHRHVVILPWDTNAAFTHEVPHRARDGGRRISITLRALSGPS